MRIHLTAAIALALLAGCSSEHESPAGKAGIAASDARAQVAGAWVASPGLRATTTSFASLPDRGELLAYDAVRKPRQSGAYTAYPVAISEAHALDAMRSGEMVVKAPNGELVRLKYERHEESPDGNWTWIGRDAGGASAVITFGEKAVFGVIPQGDETLRLTMNAGHAFLVQADRSKLAGLDGMKRRDGNDQPVPPKLSAAAGLPSVADMQARSVSTAAAGASSAVVDVLIGFTNGLASELGGDSAAASRASFLVSVTNQAYVNSGVSMRVRLVKAMKVNYPDGTDNGDALEALTGYRSGDDGGPIDPDPAFEDLRKAREDTGADLVSLVRRFQTPENNGCGIAWLLGGDESGINSSDAPFGYSVVSDGTDQDEDDGHTYYCREETLAHELGHNMGQAHNEEDSDGSGVHPYSYGYRESSSTGFYTVMAYPQSDGSQFSIPYFANPNVKYKNRVTGTASKSDNVRSMNQTMPIVATFRATVVPLSGVPSDFNGDGKSDVLWRNFSSGRNKYWSAANAASDKELTGVDGQAWFVAGVGDFAGDGKADIVWRNKSNDGLVVWKDGDRSKRVVLKDVSYKKWKLAGIGDFNGDGKADILWRSSTTGENVYWSAASSSARIVLYTLSSQSWVVAGIGDFNGDGRSDILWRNLSDGRDVYWNGGVRSARVDLYKQADKSWKIVGVGDFNGDGKSDILWRDAGAQRNRYWSGGLRASAVELATTSSQWSVAQIADFNGDGLSDILWHKSNGDNVYWSAGKQSGRKVLKSVPDTSWHIVP